MTDQYPPAQPGDPGQSSSAAVPPTPESGAPGYGVPPTGAPGYGAQQPYGAPPAGAIPFGATPYGAPPMGAPGYGAQQPYGAPPAGPPGYGPPGSYPGGPAYPAMGVSLVPLDVLGRPLAEWWQRLVAWIIDGFVLAVPLLIVIGIFDSIALSTDVYGLQTRSAGVVALGEFFAWVIAVLYLAIFFCTARGQTLGQLILGIAVRDRDSGGQVPFGRCLVRAIILEIPFVGLLSGLWPLWDPHREGLHDKGASTRVIRVR